MKMIRAMNGKRMAGMLRTFYSFHRTRLTGKLNIPPLPFSLAIEPTTACNLRCPECPSGLRSFSRPTGNLTMELFRNIIDQVFPHCGYLTFYFQGEPFLNKEFLPMVSYASEKKIFTVTSTNAHYLDKETALEVCRSGLGRLIISLDGITPESYEKYRIGGDLEKVKSGIIEIVAARRSVGMGPELQIQFIVMKHNRKEMKSLRDKAQEWGVDKIVFKTVQIYSESDTNNLVPDSESLSRYQKEPDGKFNLKNSLLDRCWKLWSSAVITWDGKVVPCCFDKDASYVMGDLRENTFAEIWRNATYNAFRRKLIKGRKEIDICKNCSEGTKIYINPAAE